MKWFRAFVVTNFLAVFILGASLQVTKVGASSAMTANLATSTTVGEGKDFATLVLHDPWDMSQFSDVSQYLNESGQRDLVRNISVSNGIYSGTSVGSAATGNTAAFFPLFPGYDTAVQVGKIGNRYPIDKTVYKCLHIAMKMESASDKYQVFWFPDQRLSGGGAPWGYIQQAKLTTTQTDTWRLYTVNLSTATPVAYGSATRWDNMPSVKGLRIDPTSNTNTPFAVDWVRLTDCAAANASLSWSGGAVANTGIWLRPSGTTRYILVATNVGAGATTYTLDVQGIAPGSYDVFLGSNTGSQSTSTFTPIDTTPLVVNQTPVASFVRPSFTSGSDYATQAGNPWDFGDNSDVTSLLNFSSTSFQNGELNTVTPSGPPPGGVDAVINLNTPSPINTQLYRFFTFRMSTQNGSAGWQNVVDGMMVRIIWSVRGANGTPSYLCDLVSQDITYDVGYQTYTVDLGDSSFPGLAEVLNGDCAGLPNTWKSSSPVLKMRFDPNENISCNPAAGSAYVKSTCGNYVQNLDWIRLTAVDQVAKGNPFPIQLTLNRPPAGVSLTYFYTTTLANPTQSTVQLYTPPAPPSLGPLKIFLPLMLKYYPILDALPGVDATYLWDTTSVPLGTYYICVQANDAYNSATSCSEAPVIVAP